MLKSLSIVFTLLFFLISIICIYNARGIVRNKMNNINENKAVKTVKVLGYVFCILSLAVLCYLK
ncbi:hypothetical protein D3C73_1197580 [compost metagenome]